MADVEIIGLKELGDRLNQLDQALEKKLVRRAANAGAEVFRKEIRDKAPVRAEAGLKGKEKRPPGYLKKHIGKTSKAENKAFTVSVGPTKGAFYGRYQELGTKHQAAKPFIRPAFDTKKDQAEKVFADTLDQQIQAELK